VTRDLNNIRLSIIAAVAENGVIGADNALPWRLSSDLKRFKRLTMGKPIVMGRKTYETIGKPLPGRLNIVISRNPDFAPPGVNVATTLEDAMIIANLAIGPEREIMVMGGGEIYRAALARAERLYITHVAASPDGDTHFPAIDPDEWRAVSEEPLPVGDKDSFATRFIVYERITAGHAGWQPDLPAPIELQSPLLICNRKVLALAGSVRCKVGVSRL
jgi:dihydrofolate reductase